MIDYEVYFLPGVSFLILISYIIQQKVCLSP